LTIWDITTVLSPFCIRSFFLFRAIAFWWFSLSHTLFLSFAFANGSRELFVRRSLNIVSALVLSFSFILLCDTELLFFFCFSQFSFLCCVRDKKKRFREQKMRNWCHVFALHFVWQLWRSFVFFLEKFFFTHFPQIFSFRSECIVCAVCPLCDKSFHFFCFFCFLFFFFFVSDVCTSTGSWKFLKKTNCFMFHKSKNAKFWMRQLNVLALKARERIRLWALRIQQLAIVLKEKKSLLPRLIRVVARFFFGFYSFLLSVDSRLMINDVLTFFVVLFLQRVFLCWNNSTERIDSLLVCKVLCFSC
jgi:hypothetical protein